MKNGNVLISTMGDAEDKAKGKGSNIERL